MSHIVFADYYAGVMVYGVPRYARAIRLFSFSTTLPFYFNYIEYQIELFNSLTKDFHGDNSHRADAGIKYYVVKVGMALTKIFNSLSQQSKQPKSTMFAIFERYIIAHFLISHSRSALEC